nr:PLP-dependent aminotransferase family protein [Frankia sp. ArI3]
MVNDSSIDRVVGELRRLADSGAVGEKLPSTRTLQQRLGVGPVTVQRALGRLVAEGRLVTRPGAGTFVSARRTVQASDTDWQQVALGPSPVQTSGLDVLFQLMGSPGFQLGAGYLDPGLRADTRLAAAASRAARRPDAWASSPTAGIPELRSWFGRQIGAEPENVLITPGSQGALSATFRAILPAGHPVLFATPTYPGALAVARSAGHIPIPVPGDRDGIRPELLRDAFARTSARLLVIQPTYANPDGSVLAAQRRGEVLDICRRAGAFIVEDDFARWLGFAAVTPPPPLWQDDDHGQVITILSPDQGARPEPAGGRGHRPRAGDEPDRGHADRRRLLRRPPGPAHGDRAGQRAGLVGAGPGGGRRPAGAGRGPGCGARP